MEPSSPWYRADGEIENLFYGVFEGGGAKGVAYGGALQSMREHRCWFKAVAGASAGAITASLIACGHTPEEIEGMTLEALGQLETPVWAGIRRLRSGLGYFPSEGLHGWIEERLRHQIESLTGSRPQSPVTFRQLHRATEIELNVVAADLSRSCQVVFSHHETPACSVADAVMASCSIPFAFESRALSVPEPRGEGEVPLTLHHTVMDGGVWSNFPMHIFEDPAFRTYSNREPAALPDSEILGFLLDEEAGHPPPSGEEVRFVGPGKPVLAAEWVSGQGSEDPRSPGWRARVFSSLLWPFYVLGRLLQWNAGGEPGRWPPPRARLARYLVTSIDGVLVGSLNWLGAIVVCAVVGVGAWVTVSSLVADQMSAMEVMNWKNPADWAGRLFSLVIGALVASTALLVLFLTLLGVVANFVLLRTSRRILYGLVTTYVAGSGAPAWVALRANVIPLPIPPSVGTLSFDMDPEARSRLVERARQATAKRLRAILERR